MRTNNPKPINGSIEKECAFCGMLFYAKTDKAKYCSDSHKVQFFQMGKRSRKWYSHDPNEGRILPHGTVTSWEMPEEKLVFTGNLMQLYTRLSKNILPEQLSDEKQHIENLKPFSITKEWLESSVQIFTDESFIEVFRVLPEVYKFYLWSWGEDNEKPF